MHYSHNEIGAQLWRTDSVSVIITYRWQRWPLTDIWHLWDCIVQRLQLLHSQGALNRLVSISDTGVQAHNVRTCVNERDNSMHICKHVSLKRIISMRTFKHVSLKCTVSMRMHPGQARVSGTFGSKIGTGPSGFRSFTILKAHNRGMRPSRFRTLFIAQAHKRGMRPSRFPALVFYKH